MAAGVVLDTSYLNYAGRAGASSPSDCSSILEALHRAVDPDVSADDRCVGILHQAGDPG
jgi:hypothetical protein